MRKNDNYPTFDAKITKFLPYFTWKTWNMKIIPTQPKLQEISKNPKFSENCQCRNSSEKFRFYTYMTERASNTGIAPHACVSWNLVDHTVLWLYLWGFVITRKTPLNTIDWVTHLVTHLESYEKSTFFQRLEQYTKGTIFKWRILNQYLFNRQTLAD